MTDQQKLLLKMLLTVLSRMKQSEEGILYHSLCMALPKSQIPTWSDLEWALKYADGERWLTSVSSGPFRAKKWSVNDLGRAALEEM